MELVSMNKQELRKQLLEQRKNTPQAQQEYVNEMIFQAVTAHPKYLDSDTIFVYYSVNDEIDTHRLIEDALALGKRVCVPKCRPKHQMDACQILTQNDLTEETFGIPEPGAHCEVIHPEEIDLCIIPALACDEKGVRIGYGGGFYDRFLAKTDAFRMTLCAQSRMLEQLPAEPHDIPCNCIVTDQEVIDIAG